MHDNDGFDESELRTLLDSARNLPREITPPPDAWHEVRARIDRARVRQLTPNTGRIANDNAIQPNPTLVSPGATQRQTRFVFRIAAVLLVSVSAYAVMHERMAGTPANRTAAVSGKLSPAQSAVASASIESVFAQYDTATADLTKDFEQRRARLQPEAIAVLDSCLTTINRAIEESRSALAVAPDNTTIAELLQMTYQQKLDLLRRAADLPLGSL